MDFTKTCSAVVLLSLILGSITFFAINFCRFTGICGGEADKYYTYNCQHDTKSTFPESLTYEHERISSLPWRQNNSQEATLVNQLQLMQNFINRSADPCDNFYDFACGNWEKLNPIPADAWQHSTINQLQYDVDLELRELLSQSITVSQESSAINKAKIFYKTCMDLKTINERGTGPLLESIQEMGGWPVLNRNWSHSEFDWLDLTIKMSSIGIDVLLAYELRKNPFAATEYIIYLKQTELGMSNRDNYLKEDNKKSLEAYRIMINKVLQLLEVTPEDAHHTAQEIIDFEVRLANATLPQEATKTEPYLVASIEALQKAYAYINWTKYFSEVQGTALSANQTILIHLGSKYYVNLYYVLRTTSKRTVANYIFWRYAQYFLNNFGHCFRRVFNDFIFSVTGQLEPTPIWRTCVRKVNQYMGFTTTAMFIRKYFDEVSRNESTRFTESLKEIFYENLVELDWIDEKTKAYANNKTNAMSLIVGYPDFLLSNELLNNFYQDVNISNGKHYENILEVVKASRHRHLNRLLKPFDQDEWPYQSLLVNALYDKGTNRIIILTGLLQPPIFHKHFAQSLNYGGFGTFLAHEIIHGFDDTGRMFDLHGNPFEWWSPKSIAAFKERENCFLDQYETLAARDQSFKSIATLTENLADNGGIRLAFKAYKKWKRENEHLNQKDEKIITDLKLNDEQLFFLSFAQLFCDALRPEAEVEARSYKEHSPGQYRVLGTLMNFEKFAEVYSCPLGSPMNPQVKCRLW